MMEPTITQNGGLYLAHHRVSRKNRSFFQRLRGLAPKRRTAVQLRPRNDFFVWPRLSSQGGR
jgi:hypothetical protein